MSICISYVRVKQVEDILVYQISASVSMLCQTLFQARCSASSLVYLWSSGVSLVFWCIRHQLFLAYQA